MLAMWMVLALFLGGSRAALAQDPATGGAEEAQLETVVVTGVQPGPGLWKVSKGDHVLWVLGTLSPLPEKMQWRAEEVGERIAQSQAVLWAPDVSVRGDVGVFGWIALAPTMIGIRNNPEHKKLAEVVPADLYARWQPLKQRYLGRSNKVEKWRPYFAAMELYKTAIRSNGMTVGSGAVYERIREMSKRAHIEPTPVNLVLKLDQPRQAAKDFKKSSINDLDCFAKTLDRIESDLTLMKQRANAWATGDLAALRALPYTDQYAVCNQALQRDTVLKNYGDIDTQIENIWLDAASKALDAHASSFAMLPMEVIVGKARYLDKLAARGYRVEAPDAEPEAAAAAQP